MFFEGERFFLGDGVENVVRLVDCIMEEIIVGIG